MPRFVVVGLPDPEWGQRLVAVTTGPADLDQARATTAHLAPAARPTAVLHRPTLPLRPTGKVDRRGLQAGLVARGIPTTADRR